MRIVPSVVWNLEGDCAEAIDARLLPLLRAISESQSLAAAVAHCGVSYRAAWGLLRDYERRLGEPLVLLERGRGASLAPSGERLIAAERAAARRLLHILPTLAVDIGTAQRAEKRAPAQQLRVAASHDLALAALANALPADAGFLLLLSFTGSLHALKEFAEGRADVAGFHVPISGQTVWELAAFLRGLRAKRDRLVRFVDREQGLILPQGNPAHVKNIRDITVHGLRFINRQRGSGTRLLFDQMLAHQRIPASKINGYGKEEFTHPAVAATVASKGADVGFGLRAAAAEYRLAFVPLLRERYYLALRARDMETPAVTRLLRVLQGPAFARIARQLPGYKSAGAGTVVSLDAIVAGNTA